jgi:hypothetical protein
VTKSALGARRGSSPGFRAWGHGLGRNPCISDLAITALAVIWLQKQPNIQKGRRATYGDAAGPNRRFHEPGHIGCRAVALPIPARLIHNRGNLACCPDFKVSHYPVEMTLDFNEYLWHS